MCEPSVEITYFRTCDSSFLSRVFVCFLFEGLGGHVVMLWAIDCFMAFLIGALGLDDSLMYVETIKLDANRFFMHSFLDVCTLYFVYLLPAVSWLFLWLWHFRIPLLVKALNTSSQNLENHCSYSASKFVWLVEWGGAVCLQFQAVLVAEPAVYGTSVLHSSPFPELFSVAGAASERSAVAAVMQQALTEHCFASPPDSPEGN